MTEAKRVVRAMFDAVAERAPPTLARRSAGRTTDRYSEVSEILENERTPTARQAIATTSTGLAPKRLTSLGAANPPRRK